MSDTEDSRVASLGRKRRQNPDVVQSARDAEKRRKLDNNANFVALDSDDNSETVSEDRESGEVSSVDGSTSSNTPGENPPAPQNTTNHSPKQDEHPSRVPGPSPGTSHKGVDLDAVYPETLQSFVRQQLEERDDFESVEAVLAEYSQANKPHRKQAADFLQDLNHGYCKHLSEYSYSDLKKLVQNPHAFSEPLVIDSAIKKLSKKIGAGERDFGAILHTKCDEAPWKSAAEVAFDQLKSHKTHLKACRLLKNYLEKSLLPAEERQITRQQTVQQNNQPNGQVNEQQASYEAIDGRNNVHLSELSKDELRDQAVYANLTDPADLAGGIGDECDVCGERGHAEEECSGIWTTFKPTRDNIELMAEDEMAVSCYNCGRATHWGDDCPALPDFVADFITFDTWSARNARRYISGQAYVDGNDGQDEVASVGQEKSHAGGMPTHQLAMLGEWA